MNISVIRLEFPVHQTSGSCKKKKKKAAISLSTGFALILGSVTGPPAGIPYKSSV